MVYENLSMDFDEVTPFDFVNDITSDKKYVFDAESATSYVPFVINKAVSFSVDSIMAANFLNEHVELDKQLQHDYLWYGLRKKPKKYNKWPKKTDKNLNIVMKMYRCNEREAIQIHAILTDEQMSVLRQIEDTLNNATGNNKKRT